MGLEKDISNAVRKLRQDCYFVIRDGSRVTFWDDSWCGKQPLRVMFPSLYALVDSERAMVVKVWDTTRGEGTWNTRFTRSFNDWEMDEVQNFINLISQKKKNQLERDRLLWKGDKNGIFFIKANFKLLEGGNLKSVPLKVLWNDYIPPKVCFFAWEAGWGKALTMEQLKKKKGYQMRSKCPLCKKVERDLDCLLIHCHAMSGMWATLLSIPGF